MILVIHAIKSIDKLYKNTYTPTNVYIHMYVDIHTYLHIHIHIDIYIYSLCPCQNFFND